MENRSSGSSERTPYVVFWLMAFVVILWGLGFRELWGSEDRWAEISRVMLKSGNIFHPLINGEVYFDKPLLGYWLIVGLGYLTGFMDEWIVRLPSAIFAIAGLWGTMFIGRKLWSERTGITAGWFLLTTYGFIFWSRTATADIENLACIILALAWYWAREKKPGFLTYFVFYLICFLGAHTKGLISVIIPLLALAPDLIREKRWKIHLRTSHFLAGAAALAIYLLPFLLASMNTPDSGLTATLHGSRESGLYMVFRENIERFFKPFDHAEPFYIYLYYLPFLLLPWVVLFVSGAIEMFPSIRKASRPDAWLMWTLIVVFLFFTASGSRRGYYILPMLPFCALLCAVYWEKRPESALKKISLCILKICFVLLALLETASPLLWPLAKAYIGFTPPALLLYMTPVIGILALAIIFSTRMISDISDSITGTEQRIAPLILAAAVFFAGFFCIQMTAVDIFRSEKSFAFKLKKAARCIKPSEIAFYLKVPPDLLFYMDLPGNVSVLKKSDELEAFVKAGKGILVSQRGYFEYLLPLLPDKMAQNPSFTENMHPWEKKRKSQKHAVWILKKAEEETLSPQKP
ncbi:MAG: hypothetical protein A2017_07145 [Lentisphaerae bacterium GWF2_44_16]|nr:MAG: hypothetical protein A2017_07145 [Lentisphaerae bacterium GWF2_44_16]